MPWQWPWTRHDRALFQIGDIPVSSTYAAVPVNPTTAMQHSAVWACVNLIAGSISTLPLAAYRDGDPNPLPALPPILRTPSAGWTLPDFTYAALQSLLLRGNCYGLIVDRAGAGLLPSQVELLAPERVQVEANSRIIWRVDGQEVDPASVWHVKAFTAPGQVLGLSPIQHARQAIGLGLGAEKFAAKLFDESAIPSGVLTSDQDIKPERADQLKARWRERHAGNRDIAVLGSGARFQAITIAPEEAQFLETTQANIRAIARYFGVQPELIGADSGGSLTYASVEQRALDFLTFGLRPWLVRLEVALSALLLNDHGQVQRCSAGPHRPAHQVSGARERDSRGLEVAFRGQGVGGLAPDRRHRRPGTTRDGGCRMIHVRNLTSSLHLRDGGDGRTLVGPLLPWGVEARVVDRGRLVTETFTRGALEGTNPATVPLTATHPRDAGTLPIGVMLELEERADAAHGAWHVSKTSIGDEVLELARDGVPLGLSIGFAEVPAAPAGHPIVAGSPAPEPRWITWPWSACRRMPGPESWACVMAYAPLHSSSPSSDAMGKTRWRYSVRKVQDLCIGCRQSFIGPGDRCPACRDKLRQRKRRKPR